MWLTVDPRSSTPIYQQVVDGVKSAVARGLLPPGSRMPSVRELATSMTLNHNTVAKAYQELERAHVIEVLRGRGTFVAAVEPRVDREARVQTLKEAMKRLMVEAHYIPLTGDEILRLFLVAAQEWQAEQGGCEA